VDDAQQGKNIGLQT